MKFLILEPKTKAIAPNIALMKWARWCENNGHEYQYVRGIVNPDIEPTFAWFNRIDRVRKQLDEEKLIEEITNTVDPKYVIETLMN